MPETDYVRGVGVVPRNFEVEANRNWMTSHRSLLTPDEVTSHNMKSLCTTTRASCPRDHSWCALLRSCILIALFSVSPGFVAGLALWNSVIVSPKPAEHSNDIGEQ